MRKDSKQIDFELALLDPAAVFQTPEEVVERDDLTPDQKTKILCQWDYEAREMEVAEEEGMPAGEPSLLARIAGALAALGYVVEGGRTSPTKQHGVGSGSIRKASIPGGAKN